MLRRSVVSVGRTSVFDPPEIKFRAEFDKRSRDRVVPIPEALAEELRGFKVKFAALGDGWLFPCAEKDDHWPREIFGELYDRAKQRSRHPSRACARQRGRKVLEWWK